MPEINIKAGKIHKLTRKSIDAGNKIIIHKGGTGSGKTFDLMIFVMITFCLNTPNVIATVVSESKPHLDIGAIRYAKKFESQLAEGQFFLNYNSSKSFYEFSNGSILEFFSADRIGKALGARRTLLYGNEINSLKLHIWDELARRSEIVIADFNPTAQFWLEDWLQYQENYDIVKSNYTFNTYLPETERRKIELRAERDPNFRRIHIDCEYGNYEGLVFPNFTQVEELPEGKNIKYGMDFGFSNDPTSLVAVVETSDAIYVDEMLYRTGLTNNEISTQLKANKIYPGRDVIIADNAEPKSITELNQMGWSVKPSYKGKDSIKNGIDYIKRKELRVTKRSINLIRELRNYTWDTDKNGKMLDKPVDSFNHCIDALRYSLSIKQVKNFVA